MSDRVCDAESKVALRVTTIESFIRPVPPVNGSILELSKSTRSPRSTGSTAEIKTSVNYSTSDLIPQSVAGSDKGRCLTSRWSAIGGRDSEPGF
jgi:hypothetical protein